MTDSPLRGRFLWYELLTNDVAAAKSFYTNVVGWTVTPFEGDAHPYEMWTKSDGASMGGVMALPAGMNVPPHWVMYVGVPALDEAVAQVEQLGGSVLSPVIDIPTVGRLRTMRDPQGAMFSLYEPVSPPSAPEVEPGLGDASWHELMTIDAESAMRFYTELFGWKEMEGFDMGQMGIYRMFGRAFMLGGMMAKAGEMQDVPTAWNIYFRVPDIHAAVDRVKAGGGQLLTGPMEVPGGDMVLLGLDPQGAAFALHQRKG